MKGKNMKYRITDVKPLSLRRCVLGVLAAPTMIFLCAASSCCIACQCIRHFAKVWKDEV